MSKENAGKALGAHVPRRDLLASAGACLALASGKAAAMPAAAARSAPAKARFSKDSEGHGVYEGQVHEGKGTLKGKFFGFDGAPFPAYFLTYDLPPGSSEGVHVHFLDNRNGGGSFDEYYYIISGEGQMEIDGEVVPVRAGDHVHTPLEVAHGVENTHPSENLRVFLTFIKRGDE